MTFGPNFNSHLTLAERWKGFSHQYPALAKLIEINAILWLVLSFIRVFLWLVSNPGLNDSILFLQIVQYLSVPASLYHLLTQPWSIVTYMFLHVDFFHILFNMLWLFWFGKIFLDYLNGKQLVWVYILGGVSGALFYILAYNLFPVFNVNIGNSFALGASASIMAVVAAIATLMPDYSLNLLFIGRIKLKHIALLTVVIDFLLIKSDNAGGEISHLGGMAWGAIYSLLYLKQQNKGNGISKIIQQIKSMLSFNRKTKFKVYHNQRPVTDEQYNSTKKNEQEQIDNILDKISKSGYTSLSKEEKALLFKSSKTDPKD